MRKMNFMILMLCICVVLCSAGCVTMAKNALRPKPVPTSEPTPIPTPTLNLTPPVNVSQLVVYEEGLDDYMFRTNGKRMGDWFKYQRENVEGLKDIDMQATVYASRFLDKYDYWSVNWGRYFTQLPSDGMKYLMVQARIKLIGITQEKDPRMWGPGQDHFVVQIDQEGPTFQVHKNQTGNNTYTVDTNHVIGMRIKELEDVNDMTDTVKIFDYGYYRYYNSYGEELTGDLGYIRLGEGNAWDGYLLFEVPKDTRMKDVKVLERIDGIGSVWWQLR